MKRYLFLLAAFLFCSFCERATVSNLRLAEDIISSYPDSALSILRTISPTNLKSRKTEAQYALLMSAALDKNYIDISSDSLILRAVNYYSKHGSPKEKMLSWYYEGICLKNAGELIPSMLAFEKAENEATHLEEWLYSGLIYRNKAALFNVSNNSAAAIDNWKKAIICFEKANADLYRAYAELSLAIDYSNESNFSIADSLINNLINTSPDNRSLLVNCYLRKAGLLVKEDIDPEQAIELFRKVPISRFAALDYGYLAQAFEMTGSRDSSDYWLEEGYRRFRSDKEVATLDYMKAYVEKRRKNFQEAFYLVDHAASVQDSVTRVLLHQSVSSALQDYYKDDAAIKQAEIRVMREQRSFGIVLSLLVVSVMMLIARSRTRQKDRVIKEQMARLALEEKERELLNRDKAHLVGSLFSEKVDHLDQLCESYFKSEEGVGQTLVFKQVKELGTKIRKDEGLFISLEKDLDRYCDGIMSKLRSQVPRIKGENLRVIMLFFAGFSYETVLIILNKNSIESLKTARSRFRKEIMDAHAPDSEFFLKMLVMKSGHRPA